VEKEPSSLYEYQTLKMEAAYYSETSVCRIETESDGTRRSTGGEVKGKEANGMGSQHSFTV